ncbi:MAG TPA: hypothetical protein VHN78_02025 [Chloroflexota bacterium]|nr:hypothetical protein [Chloroflexota bacterium]
MVSWIIVMAGIMLIGVVVVFKWKQRQASHIAYWHERARTLDPKRPYVAKRLAEVDRRQHTASAPAPVAAGG